MTNDEMIAMALKSDYLSELSVFESLPNIRIRHGFDQKMRKMIKSYYKDEQKIKSHKRIKLRILIAAAIIAAVTAATGAAVLIQYWDTFTLKYADDNYILSVTDTENAPLTIEEIYRPDYDLSDYVKTIVSDSEQNYTAVYRCEDDRSVIFSQTTKEAVGTVYYGAGNVQIKPEKIQIGDCTAMYYTTGSGEVTVVWDNGDYLINIATHGLSKQEAFAIADSVKKVDDISE